MIPDDGCSNMSKQTEQQVSLHFVHNYKNYEWNHLFHELQNNLPHTTTNLYTYNKAKLFVTVMVTEHYDKTLWHHDCRNIQGVTRLQGITAGGDFLGLCDQKSSYKHVSDFGRLWSYGCFLIPVHALV